MHSDGAETALQERGGAGHPRTLQTATRLSAVSSDTPVLRWLPSCRDSETQVNSGLVSTVCLVGGGPASSLGASPLATPATGEVPPAGAECHVVLTGPPAKQGGSHMPPWGRREPPRSSGLRPQHCCRGSPPCSGTALTGGHGGHLDAAVAIQGRGGVRMDLELRLGRRGLPGARSWTAWPTLGGQDLLSIRHREPLLPDFSPGRAVAPPPGRHRASPPERGMKLAACVVCEAADLGNLHSLSSPSLS